MKKLKNRESLAKALDKTKTAHDAKSISLTEDGRALIVGRVSFLSNCFGFFTPVGRAFRFGETVPLQNTFPTKELGYTSRSRWVLCGDRENSRLCNRNHFPEEGEVLLFFFLAEDVVAFECWLPHMSAPLTKVCRGSEGNDLLCFALHLARKFFPDDSKFAEAYRAVMSMATDSPIPESEAIPAPGEIGTLPPYTPIKVDESSNADRERMGLYV